MVKSRMLSRLLDKATAVPFEQDINQEVNAADLVSAVIEAYYQALREEGIEVLENGKFKATDPGKTYEVFDSPRRARIWLAEYHEVI